MNDAEFVGGFERVGNLSPNWERLGQRDRATRDVRGQILTLDGADRGSDFVRTEACATFLRGFMTEFHGFIGRVYTMLPREAAR